MAGFLMRCRSAGGSRRWRSRDREQPRTDLAKCAGVDWLLADRAAAAACYGILERGSHEWIYLLAREGFRLGQSYVRGEESYIPAAAKWRPRYAVDINYVWHDLEVNDWMLAYTHLLGAHVADWLAVCP